MTETHEGVPVALVGLATSVADTTQTATGAAASFSPAHALTRAYFELLERIALSVQSKPKNDGTWIPSLSNGVALHSSLKLAKQSAEFELIERDRVLRSWAGEFAPTYRGKSRGFSLYSLDHPLDPRTDVQVAMCVRDPDSLENFSFGFGASQDWELAVRKAVDEALQRFFFLKDEPLPSASDLENYLNLPPGPQLHLDWFRTEEGRAKIRLWLEGQRPPLSPVPDLLIGAPPKDGETATQFRNLTPPEYSARLYVIQAESPSRLRLFFGRKPGWDIHPIA